MNIKYRYRTFYGAKVKKPRKTGGKVFRCYSSIRIFKNFLLACAVSNTVHRMSNNKIDKGQRYKNYLSMHLLHALITKNFFHQQLQRCTKWPWICLHNKPCKTLIWQKITWNLADIQHRSIQRQREEKWDINNLLGNTTLWTQVSICKAAMQPFSVAFSGK